MKRFRIAIFAVLLGCLCVTGCSAMQSALSEKKTWEVNTDVQFDNMPTDAQAYYDDVASRFGKGKAVALLATGHKYGTDYYAVLNLASTQVWHITTVQHDRDSSRTSLVTDSPLPLYNVETSGAASLLDFQRISWAIATASDDSVLPEAIRSIINEAVEAYDDIDSAQPVVLLGTRQAGSSTEHLFLCNANGRSGSSISIYRKNALFELVVRQEPDSTPTITEVDELDINRYAFKPYHEM